DRPRRLGAADYPFGVDPHLAGYPRPVFRLGLRAVFALHYPVVGQGRFIGIPEVVYLKREVTELAEVLVVGCIQFWRARNEHVPIVTRVHRDKVVFLPALSAEGEREQYPRFSILANGPILPFHREEAAWGVIDRCKNGVS